MLACLLTLGFALVACSDDDDDAIILEIMNMQYSDNYAWIISSNTTTKSEIDADLDKIFGSPSVEPEHFIAGSHSGAKGVTFKRQLNREYTATIPLYSDKEFKQPWYGRGERDFGFCYIWIIELSSSRKFYKKQGLLLSSKYITSMQTFKLEP